MKNSVWIAVSLSLLTSIAQAEVTVQTPNSDQSDISNTLKNQVQSLNVSEEPAFDQATPCAGSKEN